jgi:hypothetical protein
LIRIFEIRRTTCYKVGTIFANRKNQRSSLRKKVLQPKFNFVLTITYKMHPTSGFGTSFLIIRTGSFWFLKITLWWSKGVAQPMRLPIKMDCAKSSPPGDPLMYSTISTAHPKK